MSRPWSTTAYSVAFRSRDPSRSLASLALVVRAPATLGTVAGDHVHSVPLGRGREQVGAVVAVNVAHAGGVEAEVLSRGSRRDRAQFGASGAGVGLVLARVRRALVALVGADREVWTVVSVDIARAAARPETGSGLGAEPGVQQTAVAAGVHGREAAERAVVACGVVAAVDVRDVVVVHVADTREEESAELACGGRRRERVQQAAVRAGEDVADAAAAHDLVGYPVAVDVACGPGAGAEGVRRVGRRDPVEQLVGASGVDVRHAAARVRGRPDQQVGAALAVDVAGARDCGAE